MKLKKKIFKATVLTRLGLLAVSSEHPFKQGASPAGVEGKEGSSWSITQKRGLGPPGHVPTLKSCKHRQHIWKKPTQIHKTPQYERCARKLWNGGAPGAMVEGHGQTQPKRLRSRVTWAIPESCKTTRVWKQQPATEKGKASGCHQHKGPAGRKPPNFAPDLSCPYCTEARCWGAHRHPWQGWHRMQVPCVLRSHPSSCGKRGLKEHGSSQLLPLLKSGGACFSRRNFKNLHGYRWFKLHLPFPHLWNPHAAERRLGKKP